MNRTMLWMGLTTIRRDWIVLMLTFAMPIVFFSIFVGIFGSTVRGSGGTKAVNVIVVDEDQSESSRRFVAALKDEESLNVQLAPEDLPDQPYTRQQATDMVKGGDISTAVIIPRDFGKTFGSFEGDSVPVDLLQDTQRDPVAPQMVAGLMQKAAMTGAPDLMIERGIEQFDKYAGGLTSQQRELMNKWLPQLREELNNDKKTANPTLASSRPDSSATQREDASEDAGVAGFQGMVRVHAVNVHADSHKTDWEAFISFQVAQTAVMFLLFSMAGGAGTLLDEQDNGTLERLLTSNVGMGGLLMGKWMFLALIGIAQLSVMFLWAWRPFGLSLWTAPHLAGFAIMTVFTACAGAAFGMILATLCKSRGQLGSVSTIIILIMSAVGGSMFPRFMMQGTVMEQIGYGTFNAWALDGYRKVFYDNLPLLQLWPQVLVLGAITIVFLLIARRLARRWEAV